IYTLGVPPETTLVFKALVVIVVCLVQSSAFRARLSRRRGPAAPATAAGDGGARKQEVHP
ncbi:ABC transporter permease, partial [Streptomyces albidoflavus]